MVIKMKSIKVTGMHCEGCVKRLKNAFAAEGIPVEISLEQGKADFDDSVDLKAAAALIEDLGFEAD